MDTGKFMALRNALCDASRTSKNGRLLAPRNVCILLYEISSPTILSCRDDEDDAAPPPAGPPKVERSCRDSSDASIATALASKLRRPFPRKLSFICNGCVNPTSFLFKKAFRGT